MNWIPFTGANTKREGGVIATAGMYTSDDRIEALEEALGPIDQLRDAMRFGMEGRPILRADGAPGLEGAQG